MSPIKRMMLLSVCFLLSIPLSATASESPFFKDNLPNGKAKEKFNKLSSIAQRRALERLNKFRIPRRDFDTLGFGTDGAPLYIENPVEAGPEASEASPETTLSVADAFALHSNPGATNVVYLDFNGHTISGTAWNSSQDTYNAKPYDRDGSPSSFSQSEVNDIAAIWHRVAEDYAAFDVDVTTEEPAAFDRNTGRILITHNKDQNGKSMPHSGAGGVAYVGVFGRSNYSYYLPALVYYNNTGGGAPKYVAEAASHEMGHNLGLSHDGTSTKSYYGGHGSGKTHWAPIMGNSYNEQVSQWSKGEYPDANNTQDDIAIIADKLGIKADDHGNSRTTASQLYVDSSGAVEASTPETDPDNLFSDNKGVITTRNDVDVFEFTSGSGTVEFTVTPAWTAYTDNNARGANLDVRLALLNAAGNQIAVANPSDDTMASLQHTVSTGTYYLSISGVSSGDAAGTYSDYGSEGYYYIQGNVPQGTIVNGSPVAQNDSTSFDEDTTATISVLNNDSDPDGDSLTITVVTGASLGQVSTNGTTISYLPNANANGNDQISYTISDGNGGSDSANVNVVVRAVNDAPVANNDSATTDENSATTIAVLSNDTDIDGDNLSLQSAGSPNHGSTNISNGKIVYTPDNGYSGQDNFTYTVKDTANATATATVSITVNETIPVNSAPNAVNDSRTINEDTQVSLTVLDNDSDPDGDSLSITSISSASRGQATINGTNIKYVPNSNTYGSDQFTYTIADGHGGTDSATVSITINPVNDAPVATNDAVTLSQGDTVNINVLANDSDIDGDSLSLVSVSNPGHGTASIDENQVKYTAASGYSGQDSFTYTAKDAGGASATATVNVTIQGGTTTDTVILQDGLNGYHGAEDTFLSQRHRTTNFGSHEAHLDQKGYYIRLYRFAIFESEGGPVPDGAIIQSASLKLYKYTYYNYSYELFSVQQPWSEHQATWNLASNSESWSQPGGLDPAADISAGAVAAGSAGWQPGWVEFDLTSAVDGISNGQNNHGWSVIPGAGNSNLKRYYSNEYSANPALRPKLEVEYTINGNRNRPPQVSLTSPANGNNIVLGNSFNLSANASDPDGQIDRVEFYGNGVFVGESLAAPHQVQWAPTALGQAEIKAVAYDNDGASTTSANITVNVSAGNNGSETVVLQNGLNGYDGTQDTHLSRWHKSINFGGASNQPDHGKNYVRLYRFAIFQSEGGPVPDGAVIQSAVLKLYKYTYYNYSYELHNVLRPWTEKQATWNQASSGNNWSQPGGLQVGSDISASPAATANAAWQPGWVEFDVTNAVDTIVNGQDNLGWSVISGTGNSNLKRYYTSESTDNTSLRPKLEIKYAQ